MNRLRTRLILVFFAATLPPLALTLWLAQSLVERSLAYASTRELDEISRTLEQLGREFYNRERESLRRDADSGLVSPERFAEDAGDRRPAPVAVFQASGERERFQLAGDHPERLLYMVRRGREVWLYARPLDGIRLGRVREQYARARDIVDRAAARDLRRGFFYTLLLLAAVPWLAAFTALLFSAGRVTRPVQQLTAALHEVGRGNLAARVPAERDDEIGAAMDAFNRMTAELESSRERLLYLTRLESWQALARKMAHELKNSLTPIRLTTEEILARNTHPETSFSSQAAQIIVEEVNSLERRVRAFSQFAAEPPLRLAPLAVNALLQDRLALLKPAHPGVSYRVRMAESLPPASADEDLVKVILTNLLENAAEAAGDGGTVLASTAARDDRLAIEIHDSGPGLSEQARASLFEPSISFKKGGMGLGLSIARKSAVLCGGDIELVKGELGGAAFRVLLPVECRPRAS